MRRTAFTVAVVSAALLIPCGSGAQQEPGSGPVKVPDVYRRPGASGNTWVSAKAAADPDTVVKWELFGETSPDSGLHSDIRRQQAAARTATAPPMHGAAEVVNVPQSECGDLFLVSSEFSETPERPAYTLDQLVANALGIYSGTIVAITPGFVAPEIPSELLTLKVQDILRGPRFEQLHLAYGVAHFRIGSYLFCGRQVSAWGEPEIGDQLLIFVYRWVTPGDPFIAPTTEKQLILETKHGLQMSSALQADPRLKVSSFSDVVNAVRRAAAAVPGEVRP